MSRNKIRIIHVEDEKNARDGMAKIIELFIENAELVGAAESLSKALPLIETVEFDLLFLDLNLTDGDGFFVLDKFPEIAIKTIFTTADDTKGIKALKYGILDYLIKPYTVTDIQNSVNKISQRLNNEKEELLFDNKIKVHDVNGVELISIDKIIRFESDANYTKIHLIDGEQKYVSKTLKVFYETTIGKGFIRVHQSHLVNAKFIVRINKIDGGSVTLSDGTIIKCSSSGRELIKKVLGV